MWVIFYPTIIAEPEIEFREKFLWIICWMVWLDFVVGQSTPQILINAGLGRLATRLRLRKAVCGPNWMLQIPLFWVLWMLVIQSSCFAIRFPPSIFHSNYLPMTLCCCWIRGTGEFGLQSVSRFLVGTMVRWWLTRYIVYVQIINSQLVDGHLGAPTGVKPWWLRVIPAGRG